MNAAARFTNQGALSRGWVISVWMTRFQFSLFATISGVLISALGLVYSTNTTRSLTADIQQLSVERDQLHIQREKFLLEKSHLVAVARVESLAQNKLAMTAPIGKEIIVVREDK